MSAEKMVVPRRSLLYMPGANARALEKAEAIDCDTIIFDLEDAVASAAKTQAREQVRAALAQYQYGYRELVVRCNALETEWGLEDLQTFATAPISALLFPKIENPEQILRIKRELALRGSSLPLWIMVETPTAVLNLQQFADDAAVTCLVMGTSDLVKELRAEHLPSRSNLDYALQHCVLVARHLRKDIFDGVHLDFRNVHSLREACEAGRAMGFDGKTLIHPDQVPIANEVFGYGDNDVDHAQAVLEAWHEASVKGRGVAELNGQLIENLHAEEAQRVVAYAKALAERT
jgi:citrate lyase subunit beta/citryl-CoA lyase